MENRVFESTRQETVDGQLFFFDFFFLRAVASVAELEANIFLEIKIIHVRLLRTDKLTTRRINIELHSYFFVFFSGSGRLTFHGCVFTDMFESTRDESREMARVEQQCILFICTRKDFSLLFTSLSQTSN